MMTFGQNYTYQLDDISNTHMVNYGREVDDFYKQSSCKQQPYQKPSCCMIGVLLEA
jgi:hypothetical protein